MQHQSCFKISITFFLLFPWPCHLVKKYRFILENDKNLEASDGQYDFFKSFTSDCQKLFYHTESHSNQQQIQSILSWFLNLLKSTKPCFYMGFLIPFSLTICIPRQNITQIMFPVTQNVWNFFKDVLFLLVKKQNVSNGDKWLE